jgi:predicted Zn-ribbon and HTH transcriptional regulator
VERSETLRAALRDLLRSSAEPLTIRELSQSLGASERELYEHFEHLARSLAHSGEPLKIEPSRCLACGFEFEERTRFKKPGRCPKCKSTRISPPRFGIANE